MRVPFLDINIQNALHKAEIHQAFAEVYEQGAFAGGAHVTRFEEDFAAFTGSRHVVGVGSGTEALWLTLLAEGIGPGDEVITVPSTFMATAEAITYCGATPVFVDIDPVTYTLDPAYLEGALTPRTRAIIPVHLFGQPADMEPIVAFARRHGLAVIEDAAQAHGAKYLGENLGLLSDAACYSFYPGKNLGALGEAGAVTTQRGDLAAKLRMLRDHGQHQKYHHSLIGWNSRMDGIQAAALRIKLRHLPAGNEARRHWAARYEMGLREMGEIALPEEAAYAHHVYHLYAVRVEDRDGLSARLAERGVNTGIHYPTPVHLQPAYSSLGYRTGAFPVAEECARCFLSLPMFPELTESQVDYVIGELCSLFATV